MGQRHNRRRTRPRSTHRNITPTPAQTPQTPQNGHCQLVSANSPCTAPSPPTTLAPSWHNGYTAWQTRERSSRLDFGLEEEQFRLFGGEPGDDLNLCYRMLEYFGGLDYIDSTCGHALGD